MDEKRLHQIAYLIAQAHFSKKCGSRSLSHDAIDASLHIRASQHIRNARNQADALHEDLNLTLKSLGEETISKEELWEFLVKLSETMHVDDFWKEKTAP